MCIYSIAVTAFIHIIDIRNYRYWCMPDCRNAFYRPATVSIKLVKILPWFVKLFDLDSFDLDSSEVLSIVTGFFCHNQSTFFRLEGYVHLPKITTNVICHDCLRYSSYSHYYCHATKELSTGTKTFYITCYLLQAH